MKRLLFLAITLAFALSAGAQTPEAILESISKYPNHAYPEAAIYPGAPTEGVAAAPEVKTLQPNNSIKQSL